MTSSPTSSRAPRGLGFLAVPVLGLTFGLFSLSAAAQGPAPAAPAGRVSGTLLDQGTGQPLPFASVVLLRAQDSSFVAGAETLENGLFRLDQLGLGSYLLKSSAVGYQGLRRRVVLTAGAPELALGTLRLASISTQLKGVTVTGERATVENEPGKRVINVEKDLASVGGMATDVLRNVPSVAVDAGGTVSLRGSSNLTILIDGKPSGGANGGPGLRLDQIPASRIARIEVMTNPSAKYDAQGTGVINVILKKQTKNGVNGTASVLGGTGDKYNASLNLNRKQGPANLSLSYDRQDETYRNRTDFQQTSGPVATRQQGHGQERDASHSLNLGLNLDLGKEQSLSLSVNPTWQQEFNYNQQLLSTTRADEPTATQQGVQQLDVDVKVLENVASYRHGWEQHPGRELTAVAGAVLIRADIPVTQTLGTGALNSWRQQMNVDANIYFAQADYTLPLPADQGKIETGFKVEQQRSHGSADLFNQRPDVPGGYVRDPARSLAYTFRQTVPAAYATYQRRWAGWNAQAGLRTEYTRVNGAVEGGRGRFDLDYLGLFPTASLSHRFGGRRDTAKAAEQPQQLSFSYARRLNRPNFMQQLAVPLYQDPRFYRLGNPELRAEFSHNLELGHQLSLPGGAEITTTLFGRFTNNAIQRLRDVDTVATNLNPAAGLVLVETYRNLGSTTNVGLELTWSQPITAWWRVQANGSLYRAQLNTNAPDAGSRQALTGTARLNQNFSPTPTLDVQLTGAYRSATLTAQGRQLATGGLDVALRQRLWQNRAALTLRVSDLLNTQVRRAEVNSPDLQSTMYSKAETRVGWLGFTWYVGASKAKAGRIEAAPKGGGGGFGG
ncbi:outer membrane beta-barrel protein [Hymenobacter actinosclerus]|uniref:Outer membrane receptor proteins, mostly Fe transport n=1 Tax=Hymenobacter actinosclerus TaxID=82805 RepID=A0A1I0JE33_9BACT|nr:outer membrane beta-barrel protein [Hymenobacter actinosclerus]SEU07665.1 Outer membrane receptor proteins, mostly Fe transport [Hymenobacter actinosclerus]